MELYTGKVLEPRKEFYGKNVDTMPELLAAGYLPGTVANIMDDRQHPDDKVRGNFRNNYFDTGDMVFRKPDGETKLWRMPEDPIAALRVLKLINPKTPRSNGAILLTEQNAELYDALTGPDTKTFTPSEATEYFGKSLTEEQARTHPAWQFLARTQERLDAYVPGVFKEGKDRFQYDTMMGAYLAGPDANVVNGRAWLVDPINYWSDLSGDSDLGLNFGRLVGVAPEAQSRAKNEGLDRNIQLALADRTAFGYNGTLYVPVGSENVQLRE